MTQLAIAMKQCLMLCLFCLLSLTNVSAFNAKRSAVLDEDATIRTEYVDKNNRTIWAMFNLTDAQVSRIIAGNNANNKTEKPSLTEQNFQDIKEYRLNDIRNRLQSAFKVSNSEESQEHPLHEMAAYPICNSESNESSWLEGNNVTIRFSDGFLEPKSDNLNLDSAILRLYKVNPNGAVDANQGDDETPKSKRCADNIMISPQIRVTVSIVQQVRRNKRERKKRICNTIMMNGSKTGWVEIDIRRAIYLWENFERQQNAQQAQPGRPPILLVGWLMIEVHDEEERPLKPGLYFQPPKCDQADLAIPWNYYRPHASGSLFAANEVPRYPRLDVKLIGYASFAPKTYNKEVYDKLRDDLRNQLWNYSNNSAEIDQDEEHESTTLITPTADNLIESSASTEIQHNHRKRHSHHAQYVSNNSQEEHSAAKHYYDSTRASISSEENVELAQQVKQHSHNRRRQHGGHHHQHQHNHHSHTSRHHHSSAAKQHLDDC